MKKLLQVFLPSLFSIPILFSIQNVHGQDSLHVTLRNILTHLETAKDETLRKAVKEANTLYTSNAFNDSLSKKLLTVGSLLVKAPKSDQQMALSYAVTLVQLFKNKPPRGENPDYPFSLNNLAAWYYHVGQYEKALPLVEEGLAIRKKILGPESGGYLVNLGDLANLYVRFGQYDKALRLFEQVLVISKKIFGENDQHYAINLSDLANTYSRIGQYEKALPLYKQCLTIRKKIFGEKQHHYVSTLNNLAILYTRMGQYEKALPLFQKGLTTRQEALVNKAEVGKEHLEYSFSLNNFALLYVEIGQYAKALTLFNEALAIREKALGKQHPDYVSILQNLADLYYKMRQFEQAITYNKKTLALRKESFGEKHPDYGYSLYNLARLNIELGKYQEALPLCLEAISITKKVFGEDNPSYALNLDNLGVLYYEMGRYDKAFPLLQQSLSIRKKVLGSEHPDYSRSLNNLALLYIATGNPARASALLTEASDHTLNYLKQTYVTLSEQEKLKLLEIKASQFDLLTSLSFIQSGNQPSINQPSLVSQIYANELTLKGMVLEDQQGVLSKIRKSGDSTALHLYEQWRFNKSFLGAQLLLPIAKRLPYLDSLQEVTNQLEQQLSLSTASFRSMQRGHAIDVKKIVQRLHKGEAAVEYVSFKLYRKKWTDSTLYVALVLLPGDTTAHFIPLFEEKQLQKLMAASSAQINPVKALHTLYSGGSLYQLIWKPLEKYLQGVHTVYYAPAGLLHRIAFQGIQTDSIKSLINTYQLHQVLSTRSVAFPLQVAKKPASASIWGNIDYGLQTEAIASRGARAAPFEMDTTASLFDFYNLNTRESGGGEWRALPGTKEEMESITRELLQKGATATIDSGSVATENAFKAMDGKSKQVLHLATHGFFLPATEATRGDDSVVGSNVFSVQQNPMFRSGLILSGANYAWTGGAAIKGGEDGILTAYEIAQMDLSNTDLVVLSACETALGDLQGNEGALGLERSFKMAGVKQMIISLWSVPDKQTAVLMAMFYHNWLNGQSIREALRAAQLKMKEKYSPYFWAAFVVVE